MSDTRKGATLDPVSYATNNCPRCGLAICMCDQLGAFRRDPNWRGAQVMVYGGAPAWDPLPPGQPLGGTPDLGFFQQLMDAIAEQKRVERETGAPKQEHTLTVAARVDAEGTLHLRISIDGVHIQETSVKGTAVAITRKF